MFEGLVVSTAQRRKHTTAKFFCGTVLLYAFAIGCAFVISILFAEPKLAASDRVIWIPPTPPFPPPPPNVGPRHNGSGAPTPPDPRHAIRYEDLVARQHNAPPRLELPSVAPFSGSEWVVGGDSNALPSGTGVGTGVTGSDAITSGPPRPPDPPKPRPRVADDRRPVPLLSRVLQGKAIERVVPVYPEIPKRIHLQGEVSVEVVISPEGRVESARASGHPLLVAAARDAALRWRFGPTILNGVPVRVTGVITFVFKMNE